MGQFKTLSTDKMHEQVSTDTGNSPVCPALSLIKVRDLACFPFLNDFPIAFPQCLGQCPGAWLWNDGKISELGGR